jgi:site-specific DNA-methyltransferase (adenine-specific)
VLTDPPYSDHVHSVGSVRRAAGGQVNRTGFGYDAATPELMTDLAAQLARTPRWVGVFSDVESCHLWRGILTWAGLDYVRTCAWVKDNPMPQLTGDRPAAGFEVMTLCHPPGKKRWSGGGTSGAWKYPGEKSLVPGQKPLALMKRLVGLFSEEGETVLDPFAGSGTTGVACLALRRRCVLVEQRPEAVDVIVRRLEAARAQLDLFP